MKTPDIDDVKAAQKRLAGHANRTPLLHSDILDARVGGRVFLKPECLQRTGSFKFRGAFNALTILGNKARKNGVVACSSGNHAQGVAEAGRLLGVGVTIVMPDDAPALKRSRTQRSGANVITYDRNTGDRDALTNTFAQDTGAIVVHPFNNELVVAGQGTAGLEAVEDMKEREIEPDMVLVPTGGGGLLAGTVLAVKSGFADAQIYPVEPQDFDDYRRSLQQGEIVTNEAAGGSLCDALLTPSAGEMAFSINRSHVSPGLVVSDKEALAAVAFAFHELKIVVEPGGAVALAALLSGKVDCSGKTAIAILSGGNIDPEILQMALNGYEPEAL